MLHVWNKFWWILLVVEVWWNKKTPYLLICMNRIEEFSDPISVLIEKFIFDIWPIRFRFEFTRWNGNCGIFVFVTIQRCRISSWLCHTYLISEWHYIHCIRNERQQFIWKKQTRRLRKKFTMLFRVWDIESTIKYRWTFTNVFDRNLIEMIKHNFLKFFSFQSHLSLLSDNN